MPPPVRPRPPAGLIALLVLAAFGLARCTEEPVTPEQRLRTLLDQAEDYAEEKDAEALGDLISERYLDGRGFSKGNLGGLLAYYLNRHQSVHLLTRVDGLTFLDDDRAQVGLFVAMAGQPIAGPDALAGLQATLYRFDLTFAQEGADRWRLVQAQWRRAQAADFI